MQNRTKTEEFLRAIELPEETKTYAVISHGYIIDKVREMLDLKGFVIKEELYKGENRGQEAMAFMQLENAKDPDMGMTFNWTNSYNKKLKFSCAIGGFIYDSKVPFVSSDSKSRYNRLHKGTALSETTEVIEQMIEQAEEHFDKIIEMKNKFASIEVSRKDYAKLMGLLYFDKQAISSEQINIVKREYDKPSFKCNHPGTLWSLYKIIMYAIVDQAPSQWYQQQIKINNYVQILYNIAHEDNRDGDTFIAPDEVQGTLLTDEQIEVVEKEYAYPLEDIGVKPYPIDEESNSENDGQYGKSVLENGSLVSGEVVLKDIPVEEMDPELKELDLILEEEQQPGVTLFDDSSKENPLESELKEIDLIIKQKKQPVTSFFEELETVTTDKQPEEREELTCENCGSTDVIINSSAQVLCDNCGHEEETGLIEEEEEEIFEEEKEEEVFEEEDELDNFFLEEDTSPKLKEEESVKISEPSIDTSGLFDLDEDSDLIKEEPLKIQNPKIGQFIKRFYLADPESKVEVIEVDDYTLVQMESNEIFIL